jgi:S-DNA-T family DNA segregation ATPase FtsK/SpoIIIE
LVDLPDSQAQRPLELDLREGGTWLAVGGPRSGRSTLLRSVLREATTQLGPDALHVHVIESGGGALAADAAGLPHAGTVVGGEDRWRILRLVTRLCEEIAARRATGSTGALPRILLLVDGIEQVTTALEDADPGAGSALLNRLLRDGGAAGVTCVLTADRAIPGSRLAGLAQHRLVLPLADRADYAVAGIPPRAVPEHRPPGRALLGEHALECQLAQPRTPWQPSTGPAAPERAPLRIPELPPDPVLPAAGTTACGGPLYLTVGPGGDEGRALGTDLGRTGGLLVAGPPGSGRTSALEAFARDLQDRGLPLLRLGHRSPATVAPSDEAAARDWLAGLGGRPGVVVVVVDDLGAPAEVAALNALTTVAGIGPQVVLLAAGQPAQLATHFQGPVAALRRARSGLLLRPGPGDADLLGVRLPRAPVPARPGSGWLITGGTVERVQVARRRGEGAAA